MAIAWGGAVSTMFNASSGTSVSISGSDVVGVVFVQGMQDFEGDLITGATWNGSNMTLVGKITGTRYRYIFAIANPPAGTSTIAFTGTASYWRTYSYFYTGAQLPVDSSATNSGTNGDITLNTTVVASNCWWSAGWGGSNGGETYSTSAGTMRVNTDDGSMGVADSNTTVGTGSQGTDITSAGTPDNTSGVIFSLAPAGGAVASAQVHSNLLTLGVG